MGGGGWRKMGGNGGKWGMVRNCQKFIPGNVEKSVKLAVNRRKMGQFGTKAPFFPIPFFQGLATFP